MVSFALHGGVTGIINVAANRVPLAYDRAVEQWWLLIPGFFAVGIGIAAARWAAARQERAAQRLAETRAAQRLAESVLLDLQSGRPAQPPQDATGTQIEVRPAEATVPTK